MSDFSDYARSIDRELSSHRSPDVKAEDLFNLCKGGGEAALMALCAALVTTRAVRGEKSQSLPR